MSTERSVIEPVCWLLLAICNSTILILGSETKEFVMMANVMNASTMYLIEAFLKLASGEISTGIWIATTNILPYDGTCEIEDATWGMYFIRSIQ
jgi:hypothetical protein